MSSFVSISGGAGSSRIIHRNGGCAAEKVIEEGEYRKIVFVKTCGGCRR